MNKRELREIQREAYRIQNRLLHVDRLATNAAAASPSLETATALELLAEEYLKPLGHSLESDVGQEPSERLAVTSEGIKDVLKGIGNLLKKRPSASKKDMESVEGIVADIKETFLDDKWLSDKEFSYKSVTLRQWGFMFHRNGKLVKGIVSDVREEVSKLQEVLKELNRKVPEYRKALKGVYEALGEAESAEQAEKIFKKELRGIPASPAESLASDKYSFLGYPKGENVVVKSEGIWTYNWKNKAEETVETLPALGRNSAVELGEFAVELEKLYKEAAEHSEAFEFSWDDLPSAVHDLEGENGKLWKQMGVVLHEQSAVAVCDDLYMIVENCSERLINAISQYLKASLN